ncbi:MAG: glycosyltransferase family 2 protein [Clostridia bacterium]|nr:glycosyltransferase family 2 protein [Clostridia bacterium]MBQ6324924.1 glycosyltransferase family 2 protein [Clostridia bacterium]
MANIEEKDCSTLSEGAGPLVSVIVPVYNVRPYIEEALDSLVAQTYGHLEFLLVDDGSNDGSGEVCDRYASRDARFRVIHQENRGLSATRNAGLDCMSGDYVAFLDPDDAFHPDMIRRLLEPILRENADIAVCRYQDVPSTKIMKHSSLQNQAGAKTDRILGHREALSELADGTLGRAVWNKLSVRVLWHDLRFPEGHVFECTDIIYRVFDRVRTCCVVDDVLVFHRIRPGSISQNPTVAMLEDWLPSEHYMAYMQAHSPSIISQAQLAHIKQTEFRSLLWYYGVLQRLEADTVTQARWRRRVLKSGHALKIRDCDLITRVAYVLARRCPKLFGLIIPGYRAVRMALDRIRTK